ncbi:carotenoid oxygenase family protein [Rhizobium sp. FY34]|uniref:carotenoid oxygenase family protein n=1 Tax=Rhizobium sp. FY34 TaxID=2562309 RepID=UPI0010C012EB|nr:carotenoid oxygenase family protein [Rhizobium sp. FY34]
MDTFTPSVPHGLRFPQGVAFDGWFAPSRVEADVYDLEVIGRIPEVMNGAYYKAAADPQYPPLLGEAIYLDGDGMVTMLRLENGHADLRTRYVRTPRFIAEREARRSLFGKYRNPFFDDPAAEGVERGTANTAIGWHAGKLFALKEDSRPIELDPNTLDTIGYYDFDKRLTQGTFTAHPKIDPETGELIAFSYNAEGIGSTTIWTHVISPDGQSVQSESFEAPYASMVHDFLVSRNYIAFTIHPMVNDLELVKRGEPFFRWMPERGARVAVIPRKGGVGGIRWFNCPTPVMEAHTINAFDENGVLYLDHDIQQSGWFSQFPSENQPPHHEAPPIAQRWRFDMNSLADEYQVRDLTDDPGEMPAVDPRFLMREARHVFMGCVNPKLGPFAEFGPFGPPFNAVVRIDTQSGARKYYYAGPTSAPEEPVFVPKSADAPEGDGWIITIVERRTENRSDFVILDSATMEPVATIKVPFRLRYGFHGKWLSAAELGW